MSDTPLGWRGHPLAQLTAVRFLEFVREPEAVFWTFIFPVLLAAGLGLAFRNRAPDRVPVAVLGSAPGAEAAAAALGGEEGLRVEVLGDSAAARALATGRVDLVVAAASPERVEYRYDDLRPEGRGARLLADAALQRAAGRADPLTATERHVREPGSRYIDFLVPGLLGMNLMGSGIWGIGFAIVDARRKKLLKRLVATPMSRPQYLGSFLLSRLAWLVLEVVLLLGFAAVAFGVPIRGSLALLGLTCLLGSVAFASLGLLLASRARTVEGVSGLMNLTMLPMWIFSGVFFSASRFPDAVQPVIRALPLTAVNDALRATMLEGSGWLAVAPQLAIIAGWLAVTFPLAVALFRWK